MDNRQHDRASPRDAELAATLDATPALLPYLPELLADLSELGASPEVIVDLLRPRVGPGARVLDLGCGKGAVALALARELELDVLGVDLFAPFLAAARRRARELDLSARCQFIQADLRDVFLKPRAVNVVIYASLGVLGRHDRCVGALRHALGPGGLIVIDDLFLAEATALEASGYEHYASRTEIERRLAIHGDRLLETVVKSAAAATDAERRMTELIRRRAERLAERHPLDARLLLGYVERQQEEVALLARHCVGAVWLLERASHGALEPGRARPGDAPWC